jgi:putative endonuclease
MAQYYVYIMASRSQTLYTGVTNDLERRVYEHKNKLIPGFTSKYNINRHVYYEATSDIRSAIAKEKQIKAWTRAKRVALIESTNRDWKDLSELGFVRAPSGMPDKGNEQPRRDSSLRSE